MPGRRAPPSGLGRRRRAATTAAATPPAASAPAGGRPAPAFTSLPDPSHTDRGRRQRCDLALEAVRERLARGEESGQLADGRGDRVAVVDPRGAARPAVLEGFLL
ncbi:hypothetical protein GCM10023405_19480 [Streptomonospora salina]